MIEEIAKEKEFDGESAYSVMESSYPKQEYRDFLEAGGDRQSLWLELFRKHNEKQRRRFMN